MEKEKRICSTLKELRKHIADANEIPFGIEECSHNGDCQALVRNANSKYTI